MAISGISGYTSQMNLTDYLTKNSNSESNSASGLLNTSSQSALNSSSSSLSSYVLGNQEALQAIFDEIASQMGGKVTFSAVREYQAELQRQFSEAVKEDLTTMGVDPDIEFTLASDGNGGIKVVSDHADKEVVETYFEKNPEMVEAFNKLQTLSNLDKARREQGQSVEDLSSRMQIDALAQWWSSEGTSYSQYMYFNADRTLQYLGISSTV